MTAPNTPATDIRTIVLDIPGLVEGSFMGSGCCVVSADDAIRGELESWPGVVHVAIDLASAQATVITRGDNPNPNDILGVVESMGFGATIVSGQRNRPERR